MTPKPGATGRYPEGKLTPGDKGELCGAVFTRSGQVVLNFGDVPLTWVCLPPKAARQLAMILLEKADSIDGGDVS